MTGLVRQRQMEADSLVVHVCTIEMDGRGYMCMNDHADRYVLLIRKSMPYTP